MIEQTKVKATDEQAEIFDRFAEANREVNRLRCELERAVQNAKKLQKDLEYVIQPESPAVEHQGLVAEWVVKVTKPVNRHKFKEVLESIPELCVKGDTGETLFRPKVLDLCEPRKSNREWGAFKRKRSEVLDEKPQKNPTFVVRQLSQEPP